MTAPCPGARTAVSPCPVCGGEEAVARYPVRDLVLGFDDGDRLAFAECDGCAHGLLVPPPTPDELGAFYRALYTPENVETMRKINESGFDRGLRKARVKAIRAALAGRAVGRIVDVGCGLGHFLRELADAIGGEAIGVEMGDGAAATAEARLQGRDSPGSVLREAFDDVELPEASVDVLTMNHFLEHHPHPEVALAKAASLVVVGGLLGVEVPRADGWGRRLLGRWWWPHLPPQHVHLFTEAGLVRALATAGFSTVLARRAASYPATLTAGWVLSTRFRLGSKSRFAGTPLVALAWVLGIVGLPFTLVFDMVVGTLLDLAGRGDILLLVAQRDP